MSQGLMTLNYLTLLPIYNLQVQDSVADSFLRACKSGNLASVQRNSDQAELSNTRDRWGFSSSWLETEDLKSYQTLVWPRHGNTGLILAAEYGQVNIVRWSHTYPLPPVPRMPERKKQKNCPLLTNQGGGRSKKRQTSILETYFFSEHVESF